LAHPVQPMAIRYAESLKTPTVINAVAVATLYIQQQQSRMLHVIKGHAMPNRRLPMRGDAGEYLNY